MPRDWHPEKIKAEIRMRGRTLRDLSRERGFSHSAATIALLRPWPNMQAAIGAFLGVSPATIWPSRYDEAGIPLSRRQNSAGRVAASSQKRKAA